VSALFALTGKPGACNPDPTTNSILHAAAKRDAAGGAPITAEGKSLLATARPWPAVGAHVGECTCGSSLIFEIAGRPVALDEDAA
jgi:hypothetical protein